MAHNSRLARASVADPRYASGVCHVSFIDSACRWTKVPCRMKRPLYPSVMNQTNLARIAAFFLLVFAATAFAETGWSIESGDGKQLNASDLSGRVVVLFYQDRDSRKLNRPVQAHLKAFYANAGPAARNVLRLGVVDATSAFFAMRPLWRSKIASATKEEGVTIYADWDGRIRQAYGLKTGTSSLLVLDATGKIRYHRSGLIPDSEYATIERVIAESVRAGR